MSYLILSRKWRPQQFADLLGQEHVAQTLKNAVRLNRVAHAFLFCGPRGVGKTSAARILAKILCCPQTKEAIPCNRCSICEEISRGTSIDVIEIDGASNNGVDSIRELRDKAHYLPTQGQNKVYIIDEVHMLSTSAFNALLKILEEPPAHLKFIFATTESHKIPATVISRCQRFDFKKISLKLLEHHLESVAQKEKIEIEKMALLKICKEARGSFRDALSLLDQANAYSGGKVTAESIETMLGSSHEESLLQLIEHLLKKETSKTFLILSALYAQGTDAKQLISGLLEYLRALLIIKSNRAEVTSIEKIEVLFEDLTDHEIERLTLLSELAVIEEIDQAFSLFLKGSQEMTLTLYPHFVFEATLIRVLELRKLSSITEILEHFSSPSVPIARSTSASSTKPSTVDSQVEWHEIVTYIKTKKPSLAALLEHGYILERSATEITVGYPKDSVFYKLLSEAQNKSSVEILLSEYFSTPLSLRLTEMAPENQSGKTNLVQENENELQKIKQQILKHQIVQEAQKLFDGKIIDVKVSKLAKESLHE